MNLYIITAGQCGSRVVTKAFQTLGYKLPDVKPKNLDNTVLGQYYKPFHNLDRDFDEKPILEYVRGFDNAAFKAGILVRLIDDLENCIGVYRHPALWQQAVKKRGKKRGFDWWIQFHEMLLEGQKKYKFPLIDFSDQFERDMGRFGDCLKHYDPEKINQVVPKIDVPEEAMSLYRKLTYARRRN